MRMLYIDDLDFKSLPGTYIIKNIINGKEYVGESNNIRKRMQYHRRGKSQLIHKALKKYGIMNFRVYCEYFPNYNKLQLLNLEESMILTYNTMCPSGYNLCIKGTDRSGQVVSDETRAKISKASMGRIISNETRNKMSASSLGRCKSKTHRGNISKGREGLKFSEDHKLNLSLSHIGKPLSEDHKLKISLSNKGKILSDETKEKIRDNRPNKRDVIQLSISGDVIEIFSSIRDAERKPKVHNSKISEVCKNKRKSAGKFKWMYK